MLNTQFRFVSPAVCYNDNLIIRADFEEKSGIMLSVKFDHIEHLSYGL